MNALIRSGCACTLLVPLLSLSGVANAAGIPVTVSIKNGLDAPARLTGVAWSLDGQSAEDYTIPAGSSANLTVKLENRKSDQSGFRYAVGEGRICDFHFGHLSNPIFTWFSITPQYEARQWARGRSVGALETVCEAKVTQPTTELDSSYSVEMQMR